MISKQKPGPLVRTGLSRKIGRSGASSSGFRDSSGALRHVGDDNVGSVGRGDTGRKLDVADVQRVTFVQVGHVELEDFWKHGGNAANFEGVAELLKKTTGLHACGFTREVDRDVSGDFRVLVNGKEVDVQRLARKRVVLDGLEEGELVGTAEVQIDENVFRGGVGQQLAEGLSIDLQVLVFGATSVDNGRDPALAAQLFENTGTGACARFGFENVLLGHDEMGVRIQGPRRGFRGRGRGL